MNKARHSRQREFICQFVLSSKNHPTADDVLQAAQERFPDISPATVYRNLNAMVASGHLRRLNTSDGRDHFDPDTTDHCHFVCSQCGSITDVFCDTSSLLLAAEKTGEVTESQVYLFGICKKCLPVDKTHCL